MPHTTTHAEFQQRQKRPRAGGHQRLAIEHRQNHCGRKHEHLLVRSVLRSKCICQHHCCFFSTARPAGWCGHDTTISSFYEGCQRKWGHPPYNQHVRGSFLLPILVDVAIACEFDGASSSLQRALNDVVPDLIGHCCDVQIHEKLRDALKLLHGEFSHLKNRKNNLT